MFSRVHYLRSIHRAALAGAVLALLVVSGHAQITPSGSSNSTPHSSTPLVSPNLSGSPSPSSGGPPASMPTFAPTPATATDTAQIPDIHDIHDLAPLTYWEMHGQQIILCTIAGILILSGLLWLLLHKKPKVPLTPFEKALKELEAAGTLQGAGQDKVFAIAASDAVRHYLENAYQMPAPERTTEEFLVEATRHAWLKGELTTLLRRFLEFCDLAKFAGQQFGAEEREQLLAAARAFLDAAEKSRQPAATPTGPKMSTPATPPKITSLTTP